MRAMHPLRATFTRAWEQSYVDLSSDRQKSCDKAVVMVLSQEPSSGLRVKPILPDKYYREARMSSGDRIVFRIEAGTAVFVAVMKHDDIEKYGKRPKGRR